MYADDDDQKIELFATPICTLIKYASPQRSIHLSINLYIYKSDSNNANTKKEVILIYSQLNC